VIDRRLYRKALFDRFLKFIVQAGADTSPLAEPRPFPNLVYRLQTHNDREHGKDHLSAQTGRSSSDPYAASRSTSDRPNIAPANLWFICRWCVDWLDVRRTVH